MLYDMSWLSNGKEFPPKESIDRLQSYARYGPLFDLVDFEEFSSLGKKLFTNFDDYIKTPILLAYQRLLTIKLADMVVGSPPSIVVAKDDNLSDTISLKRAEIDFDEKIYQAIIDYSRYGVTILRIFDDDDYEENKGNFCVWNPMEWFPIFKNDGTRRILSHVLAWKTKIDEDMYILHTQEHPAKGGSYIERDYRMDSEGKTIQEALEPKIIDTKDAPCLIQMVTNLASSSNPYGTSDYKVINELVLKATERMEQIISILDAHADPSLTGPVSLLERDDDGELVFRTKSFYGVSPGEEIPKYLTWDGQLDAAFKGLETILKQIYILSEMGEAFLGNSEGTGQAVSATAMRYKMVAPLEKARRVSNGFTVPIKKIISTLLFLDNDSNLVDFKDISVIWEDSLPKDPREQAELSRLITGAPQILSVKHVLMENYDMSSEEADKMIAAIEEDQRRFNTQEQSNDINDPSKDPNPVKKGSTSNPGKTGTKSRTDTEN